MLFTVRHLRGHYERRAFEAYIRLLQQQGIDWSTCPRVADERQGKRWLHVWEASSAAEAFCEQLRQETGDPLWEVYPLRNSEGVTEGSLMRAVILMRRQTLTAEFTLHPHSRILLRRHYPNARPVASPSNGQPNRTLNTNMARCGTTLRWC